MNVRLKRLKADYDKICLCFSGKSKIKIINTTGSPPDRYQIEYLVTSLQKPLGVDKPRFHNSFLVEIVLTGSYPSMAPQCRMLTPVFHPNIAPHAICIGDHWAAGESLPFLIVRIGEMLSYQSYNVKSPLNGEAAKWIEFYKDQLPLDNFDFQSLLNSGEVTGKNIDGSIRSGNACSNCGALKTNDTTFDLKVCINDHMACPDCRMDCPKCKNIICLSCSLIKCGICNVSTCHNCIFHCTNCGQNACKDHAGKCKICNQIKCNDCLITCETCKSNGCLDHVHKKTIGDKKVFVCSNCES